MEFVSLDFTENYTSIDDGVIPKNHNFTILAFSAVTAPLQLSRDTTDKTKIQTTPCC